MGLFWPDSDEAHGRHSLRQALYALRQELGRDVVRSDGVTLALDRAQIATDLSGFRDALAADDRVRALGIARGPFLDGFYLSGAAEFERWVEEERAQLKVAVTGALVFLANDATAGGDHDASVEWWRQLTALEPLSGRFAAGYLEALAGRGDRARALAFVRQHEAVVRRELGTEPDLEVRRLEAKLRALPSAEVAPSVPAMDQVTPSTQTTAGFDRPSAALR